MKRIVIALISLCMLALVGGAAASVKSDATLTVPDGTYGGTVTATVSNLPPLPKNVQDFYVLTKCYKPADGTLIFGYYYLVQADGLVELGPFATHPDSTWPSGSGDCVGELGYFTRNGFGRWVVLASDPFFIAG